MDARFVSFRFISSSFIVVRYIRFFQTYPAGHSVWGILQGPATGKGLAELIVNGKSDCVDLTPFGLGPYK